ncbi:MAG TPA: hypothetical protein VGI17_04535 [Solirubrobacterales bacterium]|jgi:hypothetical protein
MKAFKRWTALAIALTAVAALAVPSMASASRLESSKGILAKVGTQITLTGSSVALNTYLGAEVCESTLSYDELHKNDGTTVEAVANVGGARQECNTGYGLIAHIKELKLQFQTSKSGAGTASLSFTSESGNEQPIICKWSGASLPFTYSLGGSQIVFNKAGGLTSTGGCGSATLSGTFLVSIGSTPVILN